MKRRPTAGLIFVVVFCGAFAAFKSLNAPTQIVKVLLSNSKRQIVKIGNYNSMEDGQRAAIQELSRQLKAHPKTPHFEVHWLTDRACELRYFRKRLFLQEYVDNNAVITRHWTLLPSFYVAATTIYEFIPPTVNDYSQLAEAAIHEAARRNLALNDFQKKN